MSDDSGVDQWAFFCQMNLCSTFLISPVASNSLTMLFYCKITVSEGKDNSEGTDMVQDSGVFSSK